jgi:probable HAF family extracellular repeat protein
MKAHAPFFSTAVVLLVLCGPVFAYRQLIDLGTLGGTSSWAQSINNSGQIVGGSYNNSGQSRACLFDPTGQKNNIDLNTLIDPSSGWTLTFADGINSNGWIVGKGTYNGNTRAFLLTPEPTTLLLFGLGVTLLRRKK